MHINLIQVYKRGQSSAPFTGHPNPEDSGILPCMNALAELEKNLLPGTGPCHFFRGFYRSGRICVGRQFITVGTRVRRMPRGQGRFLQGLVLPVRQGVLHGMMAGIFKVTFPVRARSGFCRGLFPTPALHRWMSG
jgi:hypothetical protein